MTKQDARSLSPQAQEALRRRAVAAVEGGMSYVGAARTFGVHRNVVSQWHRAWKANGDAALTAQKRGRRAGIRLKGWQAAAIVRLVSDKNPDQLHLPFYLWTREAVQSLILRKYKVRLSRWTVGRYLKRWGLTPQKPARRAIEQNPVDVKRWLEEEYPAIRRRAMREKACIYWGDQAGFRSDHVAGRSYAPRGRTPTVVKTGKRFGCHMMSALTNQGHLAFRVFRGRFTTAVYLDFLNRLIRQSDRKVFLIVDRHPVHLSKRAAVWLAANADAIEVFYLPSYSPELNPDEYLNHDVKSNAVGRRRADNVYEMMSDVRFHLRTLQRHPELVRRFFYAEPVRYAA
jgi:transposase